MEPFPNSRVTGPIRNPLGPPDLHEHLTFTRPEGWRSGVSEHYCVPDSTNGA